MSFSTAGQVQRHHSFIRKWKDNRGKCNIRLHFKVEAYVITGHTWTACFRAALLAIISDQLR
jgi:hypothetical protein